MADTDLFHAWMPRTDIRETDQEYVFEVSLPGVRREDMSLEVCGDVLTVRGERRPERAGRRGGWLRRESAYGAFVRSFALPEGLHTEDARASFRDGVLTVSLRKPPEFKSRGRSVEIDG